MDRPAIALACLCLTTACSSGPPGLPAPDGGSPGPWIDSGFTTVFTHAGGIAGDDAGSDAVAISGATISAVGASAALEAGCAPPCTVVDLGGAFLSPAFHDAHVHLPIEAEDLNQADVAGLSVAATQAALRQWIAGHPSATWILAQGITLGSLPALPTRADLDTVESARPVVVRDSTLHNVWVNSAALAAANITSATADPPAGHIVRDASGAPTGILFDAAAGMVINLEPALSAAQLQASILSAQRTSLAAGYAATQGGPVTPADVQAYLALDAAGSLAQRTFLWAPLGGTDAQFQSWVTLAGQLPAEGKVHIVAFKGFVDGTLVSRTAALLAPYADDPSTSGSLSYTQPALNALVNRANQAGFPVALHAVGDRAVRAALDAFAASAQALGHTPTNRIEHVYLVDPADLPRFGTLGVVASVQPTFMYFRSSATATFLTRLGAAREPEMMPWRALQQAGAPLAFGTDYPVGLLSEDPITGMFCAIRREFADGTAWTPQQAVDPDTALDAYTAAPARIIGWGSRIGRIAPGYLADLVALGSDPRTAAATGLASNPIRGLWIGGVAP